MWAVMHIVLSQPQIPPNTGNIIRLCANCGFALHLIEPLGFVLEDRALRRAGLDYHEFASLNVWKTFDEYMSAHASRRLVAVETSGKTRYTDFDYHQHDSLVFGSETIGLSDSALAHFPEEQIVRLPMQSGSRSLNLSNSVAIVAYHAWHRLGFEGGL